jgi:hypothetical protein
MPKVHIMPFKPAPQRFVLGRTTKLCCLIIGGTLLLLVMPNRDHRTNWEYK